MDDIKLKDIPRILDINDGWVKGMKRKTSAGTQYKCKKCGRKTYRFVGHTPICSYCTSLVK